MKKATWLVAFILCAGSACAEEMVPQQVLDATMSYAKVIFLTTLFVAGAMLLLKVWQSRVRRRPLPRFVPWGLADLLLGMGVFVLFLYGVSLVTGCLVPEDYQKVIGAAVAGMGGLALMGFLLWHLRRHYGLDHVEAGLDFSHWPVDLLLAGGLLLLVLAVRMPLLVFFNWLSDVLNVPLDQQEVVKHIAGAESPLLRYMLMGFALLAAPVWEEFVFRGFLQPACRRYVGPTVAMLLTAVAFSLIHDPNSALFEVPVLILPLALALGWAYHRTQRLAAPIFLHLMHNTLSIVIILQAS